MTHEQWLSLRVGDVIVDRRAVGSPRRTVREVQVVSNRRNGSRRSQRAVIVVASLRDPTQQVTVFEADDWMGGFGKRFVKEE